MSQQLPPGRSGKPRVAVVFGGRSSEHGVSCVTAGSVLRAIDRDRYDVVAVGIAPDGRWVLEAGNPERLEISAGELPQVDSSAAPVALTERALRVFEAGQVPRELGRVDVVFPLLHGPWGEDGTIQGLLETAAVRYVGAGVLASAIGMDKHYMKLAFQAHGLPVLPYAVLPPGQWEADEHACRETVDALGYPVFVKPARAGSSFGISKVRSGDELAEAIGLAQRFDPKVIVEAYAAGARELECGVLQSVEDGRPGASVVGEVRVGGDHEFYDFAAKYMPEESTQLDVPAGVPDDVAQRVRDLAVRAFQAIGCEGFARVDFFWQPGRTVLVNEINTIPGFTPTSMFPLLWAASGVDYPALVDRLLTLALRRPLGLR